MMVSNEGSSVNEIIAPLSSVHAQMEIFLHYVGFCPYSSLRVESDHSPYWVVSFIERGEVVMTSGNEQWRVQKGQIMLHPPYVPFSEYSSQPGSNQFMFFDMKMDLHNDLFRILEVAPVVTLLSPSFYSATFTSLQAIWSQHDPTSSLQLLQMSALAIQLFCHIVESWQQMGSPDRPDSLLTIEDRFSRVVSYMAYHLDQKLTREDLAAQVNLHPGYFGRVFQRIYGMSPMEMLRELRWQQAATYLEKTEMPLAAIARQSGLQDSSYFSRSFRQRYGKSPLQYRQSVKKTKNSSISPL